MLLHYVAKLENLATITCTRKINLFYTKLVTLCKLFTPMCLFYQAV